MELRKRLVWTTPTIVSEGGMLMIVYIAKLENIQKVLETWVEQVTFR